MFNLQKTIHGVAPLLSKGIETVFGGMATKFIKEALGLDVNAKEKDIEEAIKNDPDAWVKLKEAEFNFKERIKKLDIEESQIFAADTQNAREREVSLNDRMTPFLAVFITVGFFGLLLLIIFYPIPENIKDLLQIMVGSLGAIWISVGTYYFGTSYGSYQKNILLYNKGKK